jgi:hypothetical protein
VEANQKHISELQQFSPDHRPKYTKNMKRGFSSNLIILIRKGFPSTLNSSKPHCRSKVARADILLAMAGNSTRGATSCRQHQAEVPEFPEQVGAWATQALTRCREPLARGAAPGNGGLPGSGPARAKLVKELLFSDPPFSTGEAPIPWPTTRAWSPESPSVEQP